MRGGPDLEGLLRTLLERRVELVLVGGLAAVSQGAPVTTFDVDVVHARTADNVDRLLEVLTVLDARVREPGDRALPPRREALLGDGRCLLVTKLGPLDCLGAIEGGLAYEALRPETLTLEFHGHDLRVLRLEKLLELKERWDDPESKLRAALLRRTLEAQRSDEDDA